MGISAFGDGSLTPVGSACGFRRHEAQVGHELARVLEAGQCAQLGRP
jgi:hypothetical protein